MHEMFVGHELQRGVIPGWSQLFRAGDGCLPTTSLALQMKGFDSIASLRLIDGFNGAWATGVLTGDRFMLKGPDK